MAEPFYPFVDNDNEADELNGVVRHAARIAVYDDGAAAPRVLLVEPTDIRSYLEEITATVARLAKEQGGSIPFMVIREIVENLIHAYFAEPTISILDGGDTIRFADQGPGIADKELALEYGTTSATHDMKRYIRGVGSGLPYAQQWLADKGGTLRIEDNISRGTVVTISLAFPDEDEEEDDPMTAAPFGTATVPAAWPTAQPPAQQFVAAPGVQGTPYAYGFPTGLAYPMATSPQAGTLPPYTPVPASPAMPATAWAQPAPTQPSERGMLALGYLATHESVGPTELVSAFGRSQSTWTRELKALEDAGLVTKRGGQKRYLTPAGRALMAR